MTDLLNGLPYRLVPYIISTELNQRVPVAAGPFRLSGSTEGVVDGNIYFRWTPSTALAFEGSFSGTKADVGWVSLRSDGTQPFEAPAYVTRVSHGPKASVSGLLHEGLALGDSSFEVLKFSLANFPNYLGEAVRYQQDDSQGVVAGRVQVVSDRGQCYVDVIPESKDLRHVVQEDAGFVVTHVGEWRPASGRMTPTEVLATLDMLHIWFGLLRGAWAGPVFPQGLVGDDVVWRQYAAWHLGDSRTVTTWLPLRKRINLDQMFKGFVARWDDPAWQGPLRYAVAWCVEANAPETATQARIVLSQVALELLAWVHIVETQRLRSRTEFKELHAVDRIRVLLDHIGVSTSVPTYMASLPQLYHGDASDGPGVITRVRNASVHATQNSRALLESLDGPTWHECSQLSLQYLELALLAVCGHTGDYAQRGYRGWKGDDENPVPWV